MTADAVLWGADEYDVTQHSHAALEATRRAGPAAPHDDGAQLVERVADALLNLQFKTWDFGDSVAFESLIAASDALGNERWVRFAHGWGRAWATRSKPFVRLDCTAPGRALVLLAQRFGDDQLLATCGELADFLRTRNTLGGVYETWTQSPLLAPYSEVVLSDHEQQLLVDPPPGVFVDCLHFDPPFFVALGVATGDDELVKAGVEQALGYISLLQTPGGLFDHFVLRGEAKSFGPGWGRGQGWAALGLLEVLESLEDQEESFLHEEIKIIADAAVRLLAAMMALQREDGHWYAVVDDPESGDEFSTAGFMAWAFARAVDLGLTEGDRVRNAIAMARSAIIGSLDSEGQLREVSAAVYSSTEPSHYARVPRGYVVPWGQGPALLALVAEGSR